jgi:hypothetical protein
MIEIPKPNSDPSEIEALLKSYGAGKTCYVISWYEELDGKHLPLGTALEHAVGRGLPLSCHVPAANLLILKLNKNTVRLHDLF